MEEKIIKILELVQIKEDAVQTQELFYLLQTLFASSCNKSSITGNNNFGAIIAWSHVGAHDIFEHMSKYIFSSVISSL